MSEFCKIPIDPGRERDPLMKESFAYMEPDYPKENVSARTFVWGFDSKVFVAQMEIARLIHTFLQYDKKARIVLEYDPGQERMSISGYMERDEAIQRAHQEFHLD